MVADTPWPLQPVQIPLGSKEARKCLIFSIYSPLCPPLLHKALAAFSQESFYILCVTADRTQSLGWEMKSTATLIHLSALKSFNSRSHCLFITSKVSVENIRGTACISVLIKVGGKKKCHKRQAWHDPLWSLLASTFGDVPSGLYLTPTGFSGLLADEFDPAERCFSPFMHLVSGGWKSSLLCDTALFIQCSART